MMKTINKIVLGAIVFAFLTINTETFAQVAIAETVDPPVEVIIDPSAMLDIQSTTKGVLIPRIDRGAITTPANGLLVFDINTNSFWFYSGAWKELTSGGKLVDTDGDTRVEVEKVTDTDPNGDEINFTTRGTERMKIVGNGVIIMGDSINGNFTKITTDGSLSYKGEATRWEDLTVPVTSLKDAGDNLPVWRTYLGQLNTFWFSQTTEQELFFTVQMPHGWVEGSNIKPHVHWVAKESAGGLVGWGLEYIWANAGDNFPITSNIIYGEAIPTSLGGDTSVLANKHYITPLTEINGTLRTLSSMLICRIFRDADGTGTIDGYTKEAGLLQFDFHYQKDSDGSNVEYRKW